MVNGIRKIYIRGMNKGFNSKFFVGSQVRHETAKAEIINVTKHFELWDAKLDWVILAAFSSQIGAYSKIPCF